MTELEGRVRRAHGAPLPEPDQGQHPLLMTDRAAWRELFSNPRYRGRIILILVCWLCCYPGLIYGVGAFIPVYMVDHGSTPHFVFLTFTVAYAATFLAFQFNAASGRGRRAPRYDVRARRRVRAGLGGGVFLSERP